MKIWNQPTRLRHIAFCIYACATCILLAIAGHYAVNWSGFSIKDVVVMGDIQHISQQEVSQVISHSIKGNFFTLNVRELRDALGRVPWVRHVIVKRRWPARLEIYFEEYHPIAQWAKGGLVSEQGEIFSASFEEKDFLPVLSGPEGSEKELVKRQGEVITLLDSMGLHMKGLDLSPRHAWMLILDSGVKVFLGRDDVDERLTRFSWAYRNVLHSRFGRLDYVDLRYNDGFAIRQH